LTDVISPTTIHNTFVEANISRLKGDTEMTTEATDNATTDNAATPAVRILKAHLALNVRSVERSTEFYRKMLRLEPVKVRPGYAKFDVENPPLNLTLNEVPFTDSGALSHLGIEVASSADVLALRQRWLDAGLFTRDEMATDCCYALQDKTWVRDPDGNNWEAFVVLADNLAETTLCCPSSDDKLVELARACAAGELSETPSCCTSASEPASASAC
jgi:catechol 2,3-dioxygenase-like lactoylglutathione lyase family enzyme